MRLIETWIAASQVGCCGVCSYTFSKLIDTGSEVFTTTGNSSFPENLSNRALDRGLSAFDRRHLSGADIRL